MSVRRSPVDKSSPRLAPRFQDLSKLTVEQLRTHLAGLGLSTSGNKSTLVERLKAHQLEKREEEMNRELEIEKLADVNATFESATPPKPAAQSELFMLFQLMKEQRDAEREDSDRRFRLQMEEIRQHAKEERLNLVGFLADVMKKPNDRKSESSDNSNLPRVIGKKFRRLHTELLDLTEALELKYTNKCSIEELEVFVKTVEIAMTDLKAFTDSKIDMLEDGDLKHELEKGLKEAKQVYLKHIPLANAKLAALRSADETDKLAGSLPYGVTPPVFYGDVLKFPTFWESFSPLVHDNPKVSRFYKITYLKSAMKGSASGILNGFPSTGNNYEAAIEHVLKRYGRKQVIVRDHIKCLLSGEKVEHKVDKVRGLLDMANAQKNLLTQNEIQWDQIFTQIIESQLPTQLYERWIRKISPFLDEDRVPDSKLLFEFIGTELATMESLKKNPSDRLTEKRDNSKLNKKARSPSRPTTEPHFTAQSLVAQFSVAEACMICKQAHLLTDCEKFKKISPVERMSTLIANPGKVCFRCLAPKGQDGHPRNFYQCKARCSVDGCGKPHHKLLHVSEAPCRPNARVLLSTGDIRAEPRPGDSEIIEILPTALAQIRHQDRVVQVRVAFDSMSQKSFITQSLVDKLNLPFIKSELLNISGFGGCSTSKWMNIVNFDLEPLTSECPNSIEIEAYVQTGIICSPLDGDKFHCHEIERFSNLPLADPLLRDGGSIDILLGVRYYYSIMKGPTIVPETPETSPFAIQTMFGWVLAGSCLRERNTSSPNAFRCMLIESTPSIQPTVIEPWENLDMKLERFWNQDSIGLVDKDTVYTSDELDAMNQFEKSIQFDGSKYSVSLPFRSDAPELKPNYTEAFSRLMTTEKSLRKSPSRFGSYDKAIMEYAYNGFSRKLTQGEYDIIKRKPHFFIPHHPVFRDASSSTKLRIVFDASSRNCDGYSLNDCLLKGPNLLPDIGSILLRFRTHRIALNGDIRKMFCQTAINDDHQRYQLYLWRHCESTRKPDIYIMQRVTFGVSSGPFLAIQSVHYHAKSPAVVETFGHEFLEQALRNMYVDDIHMGGDTVDEVAEIQRKLVDLFKAGGWTLVKFASNSQNVMDRIPEEARLPNCVLDFDNTDCGEAASLGLKWHTIHDHLYCNVKPKLCEQDEIVTKRSMLSKISQIYDIFGFFSGFVIIAKMLLQDLWKQKIDWNEPVDDNVAAKYRQWTEELSLLDSIKIPRYLFSKLGKIQTIQLHGFADASEKAYGAVIYVRGEDREGNVQVNYLIAKTRVAPLKAMSVARLELMAAHCLAKLTRYVLDSWNSRVMIDKVTLWSDSEIALAWIAKPSSHWKTFVRNRVQEIHDLLSPSIWKHCPGGSENPADIHSRGLGLAELKDNYLYWFGPAWLVTDERHWPSNKSDNQAACDDVLKETAPIKVMVTKLDSSIPFFERNYSEYLTIVRVTARILRWRKFRNTRLDPDCNKRLIGPMEFRAAESFLFRLIQRTRFSQDFDDLNDGKTVSCKCRFRNMDPRLSDGLIVAGNRLCLSDLSVDAAHPIILPPKEPLIEKLILHTHVTNSHSPQDTTIAILRERFHIIHFRSEVRRILNQCITCRHYATKQLTQKMGILPEERVRVAPAFSRVGLDFTGPVYIKTDDGKSMKKAYICLFTCSHSRMVHLELTTDMSTEEFLNAFKRMINRRGWCHKVISDNQLTFKKAEKIIGISIGAELKKNFDSESFQKFLTDNCIVWNYITERAPHRGAFYERMNRALKEPLRKILGKAKLTYSEFYTLLTDIESALNQRPLTYLGCDPKNPQTITPAHLALGRPLRILPPAPSNYRVNVTKRFRYLQTLLNQFWKRWSKEYLPTLLRRKKWIEETRVPKVGDVCLIADDGFSRSSWLMGRIVEAVKSKDGLIRTFKLKTVKGILTRPIQKLHLFEED